MVSHESYSLSKVQKTVQNTFHCIPDIKLYKITFSYKKKTTVLI